MPMDISLLNLLDHRFKRELKECLNPEIWEIFACGIQFWENLACGIKNTAQGIWNPTIMAFIIQVPLTKTEIKFLNYGSTVWNPESTTVLESLTKGDRSALFNTCRKALGHLMKFTQRSIPYRFGLAG